MKIIVIVIIIHDVHHRMGQFDWLLADDRQAHAKEKVSQASELCKAMDDLGRLCSRLCKILGTGQRGPCSPSRIESRASLLPIASLT
jgi:hypothetical protein